MADTTNYTVTEVHIEGLMGPKGDKGDPFTYDDFTSTQLAPFEELKTSAETAATNAKTSEANAAKSAAAIEALGDNVTVVANNITYVNNVAVMADTVAKVGKNINSVIAVEGGLDNIAAVKIDLQNIDSVATYISNVEAVGQSIDSVNTVAGLSTQIKLIGSNTSAVETLYKTLNMSVEATTLSAGSSATVNQTSTDTGFKVTFGIPQGATGAKGDKGDKGDTGDTGLATVTAKGGDATAWYRKWSDGVIECGGYYATSSASQTITLPIEMPNVHYAVSLSTDQVTTSNLATTGWTATATDDAVTNTLEVRWTAIGHS